MSLTRHVPLALVTALSLLAAPAFAQAPAPSAAPKSSPTMPAEKIAPAPKATPAAKPALLDINSASKAELSNLKGIGDVRSDAIIKGRPYKGKDDLVNKKIIPQNVYDGIKDQIIAHQKH
ncbi:MAG TPA: helix-hairpin-helix domain-containing protein [Xanthobacteraceae bacterium]|nr:helix-hairpin-helix domain-containing protein [Xanthobacteraceae bacterium]